MIINRSALYIFFVNIFHIVCNIIEKLLLTVLVYIVTNIVCQINVYRLKLFNIVQHIVCNIVLLLSTAFVNIV